MGWKDFEWDCYNYLCDKYGSERVRFMKLGESDSTQSDIFVSILEERNFYIETKEAKAQCGQFVVLPNDSKAVFEYSADNRYPFDKYSERIIFYMNSMFETYRNPGTKGKNIDLESKIFIGWIMNYYGKKGVKFFITKGKEGYIIFPIHKFADYFEVSAKYRVKKSGSSNPSKKNLPDIKKILYDNSVSQYIIEMKDKKIYIITEKNIDKLCGTVGAYEYYFKRFIDNHYVVTRLSNTRNPNVIFSIKLKQEQNPNDLKLFEDSLRNRFF